MSFTTLKSSLEGCWDCSEVEVFVSKLAVDIRLSFGCSAESEDWGGPKRDGERKHDFQLYWHIQNTNKTMP